MQATVFEATEGEIYEAGSARLRILAQAPDHPCACMDSTLPPNFPGPVPHRHAHTTDIFFVLDGQLAFTLDGVESVLGPDSFVLVPPGVVHTFRNPGSKPARMLNFFQPAGLESYLKGAFRRMTVGTPWSPEEMAEIAVRYDFEPVGEES